MSNSYSQIDGGTILEFLYVPLESDDSESSVLVHVKAALDATALNSIEDAISSYIDRTPAWGYEQLVCDVLQFLGYRFTILLPSHTFRI